MTKRTKRQAPPAEAPDINVPKTWRCIDCGINTAPGCSDREQMRQALSVDWAGQGVSQTIDEFSEIYIVKNKVWQAAGTAPFGGCLCIACLEQRLGRTLTPGDFQRHHPFNRMPGTDRLRRRRGDIETEEQQARSFRMRRSLAPND